MEGPAIHSIEMLVLQGYHTLPLPDGTVLQLDQDMVKDMQSWWTSFAHEGGAALTKAGWPTADQGHMYIDAKPRGGFRPYPSDSMKLCPVLEDMSVDAQYSFWQNPFQFAVFGEKEVESESAETSDSSEESEFADCTMPDVQFKGSKTKNGKKCKGWAYKAGEAKPCTLFIGNNKTKTKNGWTAGKRNCHPVQGKIRKQ